MDDYELDIVINGLTVRPNVYVSDTATIVRTWMERIFEKPWNPLKTTKSEYFPRVFLFEGIAVVSYQTFSIIKKQGCLREGTIIGPATEVQRAAKALRNDSEN
jgi:hypothetical protein